MKTNLTPTVAALALTVIRDGKTAKQVVFEAGLGEQAIPQVEEAAKMDTATLYAALPVMRRGSFAQFAPKA